MAPKSWYISFSQGFSPYFDICLSKRAKAVALGAVEITRKQVALLIREKRTTTL